MPSALTGDAIRKLFFDNGEQILNVNPARSKTARPTAESRSMGRTGASRTDGPECATSLSLSPSTRRITASSALAHLSGILGYRIQHRLNIRRRAGDDAQNFTRGGLLFQRLLEFLEQPHVLNGDHGLISEGFEQLNLRWGEGTHLDATCDQVLQ